MLRTCALGALLLSAFAVAAEPASTAAASPESAPSESRAFRDPVTGELRAPTPAEAAALAAEAASVARRTGKPVVHPTITLPNGAKMKQLEDELMHDARATVVDGGKEIDCRQGVDAHEEH